MSNQVYANNMEVSCKAGAGKSICSFPDVCFTPPQTPATPPGVPIPYPNTGLDDDTSSGTSTVKISGQEVMLKNKSYFKKSTGDEAGCAQKKGAVTSKNTGKVYFTKWSMDVKFEGENVVRHLDLTTHNHGSYPGNTATWPFLAKQTVTKETGPCKDEIKKEKAACSDCVPHGDKDPCKNKKCQEARKCMLVPYKPEEGTAACCPGKGRHHLIPVQEFSLPRSTLPDGSTRPRGVPSSRSTKGYNQNDAPCICVEGLVHNEWDEVGDLKEHGLIGNEYIAARKSRGLNTGDKVDYSTLRDCGVESATAQTDCPPECIAAQLDNYHVKSAKIPENKKVCGVSQQGTQKKYNEEFDTSVEDE